MKKFCTRCGHQFESVGREVICPSCKQAAAEETKRAAVERAKKASWTGEFVPVRISGRASTVIRRYGAANNLPFAAALDALLQSTPFFVDLGTAWDAIVPYKSHRRDKQSVKTSTTETAQDAPQETAQDAQEVTKAARVTNKATTDKVTTASKAASKK